MWLESTPLETSRMWIRIWLTAVVVVGPRSNVPVGTSTKINSPQLKYELNLYKDAVI